MVATPFSILNKIRLSSFVLLLLSVVLLTKAYPAPLPDSIANQDKMVVTATRTKRLVSETPASVSVITKKDIAQSPAKTIEDLLITQTGVQATRSASIGEGIPSSIIIRGIPGSLGSSRTLILVDGIPTNASGTPFIIVNEIPLESIERIEIVRGPYSSVYGANAFGGVVNIMTKAGYGKPNGSITGETSYPFSVADKMISKKESAATAFTKGINQAYWNGNGTISGGTAKTGYLLSGGYRTIGNYLLSDSAYRESGKTHYFTKAQNYDYGELRLFGKGRWYITDNCELSLHSRYFKSELGFGLTKNIKPDSLDVITKGYKFLVGPRLKWSVSPTIQIRGGAFYRQVTGEFINEGQDTAKKWVPSYWKSDTKDWQIESQGIFTVSHDHTLTAGAELLSNNAQFGATTNILTGDILPNSFSRKRGIQNGAVFLQEESKFFHKLSFVPALRLDFHSDFGAAVSPKLGLGYSLGDQINIRASSGQSFRAPSLAELYMPDLSVNPSFLLIANPDLKPEYLWGSDAGCDYSPIKPITFKVDVYYNSMTNLISQAVVFDSSRASVTHRNISKAWSQGIEGELSYRITSWLLAGITGTLQDSKDLTYNTTLDYIPNYTFGFTTNLQQRIKTSVITLNIGLKNIGDRTFLDFTHATLQETINGNRLNVPKAKLSSYTTIDFSCQCTFTNKASILLTAQNILNEKGIEAYGSLETGRFITIKMKYEF